MSDEYADAFEELLDAQEEARGKRIQAMISGKPYDAVIEDVMIEEVKMIGGDGNRGGFKAICPISRFKKPPERGEKITADKRPVFDVLDVNIRNGITYEIMAGDLVADDE